MTVPHCVEAARAVIAGPEPEVHVGHQCYHPYECIFISHCWPTAEDTRYPVQGLGGSKKHHGE